MPVKCRWQSRSWSPVRGGQSKGQSSVTWAVSLQEGVARQSDIWAFAWAPWPNICTRSPGTGLPTFGSSFPIGRFCFVGWIHFNSLSHCPSVCGNAALVSKFLVFIGFAMCPTDIYLVPAVYQAVHLLQGCARVESARALPLAAPCIAGDWNTVCQGWRVNWVLWEGVSCC